jgi:DNA-binding MarR family transcriptional regulator
MTLPAMSELVDDLQRLGIVERRPDPTNRRAKLICLTDAGWQAMRTARDIIAEIETDYAQLVGAERFETAAQTGDFFEFVLQRSGTPRTGSAAATASASPPHSPGAHSRRSHSTFASGTRRQRAPTS